MQTPTRYRCMGRSKCIRARYSPKRTVCLNDYEKFFDHIDITILLRKCVELSLPLNEVCLVLFQHTAPRAIQCAGYTSKPRTVLRSILAGCKFSKCLTKVYLAEEMIKLNADHPGVKSSTYYDDAILPTSGSRSEVHNKLLDATPSKKHKYEKVALHKELALHPPGLAN